MVCGKYGVRNCVLLHYLLQLYGMNYKHVNYSKEYITVIWGFGLGFLFYFVMQLSFMKSLVVGTSISQMLCYKHTKCGIGTFPLVLCAAVSQ